ncbi:hypothetical protein [Paraclostridium dentum]|uniref:hypothetical protein n=1 Tax=Paraclostridium dentum TaxID=2662455 RepID=UPI003F67935D
MKMLDNEIDLKVDTDGIIAGINIYTQKDENGNVASGVKIKGEKIDLEGQVTFNSLNKKDDELGSLFTENENNKTVIDGGKILTNSVTAEKMDMYSLNVYRRGTVINDLKSGLYNIKFGKKTLPVKLEMDLHGGNWVRVFYHKVDGNGSTPVLFSSANN